MAGTSYRFASPGIAPLPRLAFAGGEGTEAPQLDTPAFREALADFIEEDVYHLLHLFGAQFRIVLRDGSEEF